jgi:hypothetical protein
MKDLYQFATVRQIEILDAIEKHGSQRKAAQALGMNRRTLEKSLALLKSRAAQQLASEHNYAEKAVPSGYTIRGVSQYIDAETGKVRGQWIKTGQDDAKRQELLEAMVQTMCQDVPKLGTIKPPKSTVENLLNVIPMGDPHFGLYSWAAESGDDFDTDTARRLTLGAVDRLMASAPDAETCIILPLGDVFHANDQTNATPSHKHQLDVDTRFVRVLQIGIETYRHAVIRALEKHPKVIVRFVAGNHDPQAIWALAFTISAFFADNHRVTVDLSPSMFWYYQHGKVLIGATHGDKVKHEQLLGVMAADKAVEWGQSKHRYWYTGHVHSQHVREYPGVVCESFRTLAAKDAYAAGYGYRAGRDMLCITHHKEHGEVERHRCDIGMLG